MAPNRRLALVIVTLLGVVGCPRQPQEDLLAKGVDLFNSNKMDQAIPVLKARLVQDPYDVGAHYYLGRSYLAVFGIDEKKAYLTIAEGELKIALDLFIKGGRHSPFERFNDTFFEVTCHLQTANVYLFQAMFLEGLHAKPAIIDEFLRQVESENRKVRAISPDSAEVKQYEAEIAKIRQRNGIQRPPSQSA